ncbi:amidase family protein, partial [Rhizobium ruizarguesonis]
CSRHLSRSQAEIPLILAVQFSRASSHHWLAGAALGYASITDDDRSKLDSGFREAAEKGLRLSAVELLAAQVKRAHFGAAMDVALNGVDVVISPATAHLPFATAMNAPPNTGVKSWTEWTGFSYPLNLTGQPACMVSCGFSATGLPIGIQIIGARGADGRVLSVAKEIESLIGRYCESNHDLPRDGTRRNCKGPNCRRVEVPLR